MTLGLTKRQPNLPQVSYIIDMLAETIKNQSLNKDNSDYDLW